MWAEVDYLPMLANDNYGLGLYEKCFIIFGGFNYEYDILSNEIHSIDITSGMVKELSQFFETPGKRMKASMAAINNELYLFGGMHENLLYNDLWVFNIENEYWRAKNLLGDVPTLRHSYGFDSDSDLLALFGGFDASGYNNDLFIYNALNNKWKKIIPIVNGPDPLIDHVLLLNFR